MVTIVPRVLVSYRITGTPFWVSHFQVFDVPRSRISTAPVSTSILHRIATLVVGCQASIRMCLGSSGRVSTTWLRS
jgi:hypothetical protein